MADAFKIKYQGQATPLEVLDAAGDATSTIIHGGIGKTITGGMEYELGSDSSFLEYLDYTTTTGGELLGSSNVFNKDLNIDWIMITIREVAGTGTPDCKVRFMTYTSDYWVWLIGVGDFMIMPMRGLNTDDSQIQLYSTSSSTLAKVDILVGEVS